MIKQATFFGEDDEILPTPITTFGSKKRKPTQANGYAAAPGSGPEGEICKNCEHRLIREYHNKRYNKCYLVVGDRYVGTHGTGTDIRVRSPACSKWEE